ncbi:MAG: NAD-dependent epimerase/dehydratase family protein [Candidatus Kaiserbacteria bacterium]|nr:NAD-dependent epimerase/dehydratase family protein [Candidatus Kaiserbacteria bacterium]MCB9816339.1 NAD-dependent epimerase/dehydratase family protein [Candidatus Nomurabacteria bacterium]
MAKTFLITGGAGFIGTNLSEYLVAEGHTVKVVDDLSAGTDPARLPDAVDFHKTDIRNTAELTKLCSGVDVIVHLAALPRVQFSIEHPKETHDVNVNGTLSVLEAARAAGVGRIVYAASSSAYGDQETLPLSLDLPPQPKSPYALQKHVGEQLMRLWSEIYGLKTVSLRFFNVYGPHFDPEGAYALVIGKFLKQRQEGKPMTITGDGEQTRDFTHISDVIDAVMKSATLDTVGNGEVFNVGAGKQTSINELAKMIGGEIEYVAARLEPKRTMADITETKKCLGWEPKVKIEDGVAALKKDAGL